MKITTYGGQTIHLPAGQVLVEAEAIDSLKAMAQQLQSERDELLAIVQKFDRAARQSADTVEFSLMCDRFVFEARDLIAKCTSKPEVLE